MDKNLRKKAGRFQSRVGLRFTTNVRFEQGVSYFNIYGGYSSMRPRRNAYVIEMLMILMSSSGFSLCTFVFSIL